MCVFVIYTKYACERATAISRIILGSIFGIILSIDTQFSHTTGVARRLCQFDDMKIFLGNFNAKLSKKSIIVTYVGKHNLHEVPTNIVKQLADW